MLVGILKRAPRSSLPAEPRIAQVSRSDGPSRHLARWKFRCDWPRRSRRASCVPAGVGTAPRQCSRPPPQPSTLEVFENRLLALAGLVNKW